MKTSALRLNSDNNVKREIPHNEVSPNLFVVLLKGFTEMVTSIVLVLPFV